MEPQIYLVVLLEEDLGEQARYEHIAKLSASIARNNHHYNEVAVVEGVSECDLKTTLAECYMDDMPFEYKGRGHFSICSLAFLVDEAEWKERWGNAVSGMGYTRWK